MSAQQRTQALSDAGVSIWLDDLNREMIASGELAQLVETHNVVGVTTNPTIFANALSDGEAYDEQMRPLAMQGIEAAEAVTAATVADVQAACDVLHDAFVATGGADGRVSLEVDPQLAHDTEATFESAKSLWQKIDRPNAMIKIPATKAGLPAITAAIAEGICVNVTLIFSLDRYADVLSAYLTGLEKAQSNDLDLSTIHSVASFFISRMDVEVDRRLDEADADEAPALKGKAAVANGRLAFHHYLEVISSPRWAELAAHGANPQRPLWASTSTKSDDLPDTFYITELVAPGTVNTIPHTTLDAFADHGDVAGDRVTNYADDAQEVFATLAAAGIDYDDVVAVLENEGVDKFKKSWNELLDTVNDQLAQLTEKGA